MRVQSRPWRGRFAVAALSLLMPCGIAPALADDFATPAAMPADCLARAALTINPGEMLALQLLDGSRVEGRLASFDLEKRQVLLERWDEMGAMSFGIAADDVHCYEYGERNGKGSGVAGAVVGTVLGVVAGMTHANKDDEMLGGLEGATTGGLIGAGVGYVVGESLGDDYRPAGTITCGEP